MRKYDLTINHNRYEVLIKKVAGNEVVVEVNGREHTVAINQVQRLVLPGAGSKSQPQPASALQAATAPPSPHLPREALVAPMPGQIKAILVREGDKVVTGQKLLIMEAMKLENKLPASRDGIVRHILVRDGDIVGQGQELIIIA